MNIVYRIEQRLLCQVFFRNIAAGLILVCKYKKLAIQYFLTFSYPLLRLISIVAIIDLF